LLAFAEGRARDLGQAVRLFLREYYYYSSRFSQYLGGLLSALDNPAHRAAILQNLREENGDIDEQHRLELAQNGIQPADVAEPHPVLFRRFLVAIGFDMNELASCRPRLATLAWSETMLGIMCTTDPAQAVAALGLGTEGIVRPMYLHLLRAIRRAWPDLSARDRAFFELHALVDDEHAEALNQIAVSMASGTGARRSLALGVSRALEARAAFFDEMLRLLTQAGLLERV
jgi:pyrroloquinoline quinone (PQQ) biosynthesis protein C